MELECRGEWFRVDVTRQFNDQQVRPAAHHLLLLKSHAEFHIRY